MKEVSNEQMRSLRNIVAEQLIAEAQALRTQSRDWGWLKESAILVILVTAIGLGWYFARDFIPLPSELLGERGNWLPMIPILYGLWLVMDSKRSISEIREEQADIIDLEIDRLKRAASDS